MRFRVRHAQQTIADHIESHLTALGWTADPHPWGIAPLRFVEVQPDQVEQIKPTTVSTVIDRIGEDLEQELGGGLMAVSYELLVDVYAAKASEALSLASDVRDALTHRIITLMDYTATTPVATAAQIEFENVEIAKPTGMASGLDVRLGWRTVLATAYCFFTG